MALVALSIHHKKQKPWQDHNELIALEQQRLLRASPLLRSCLRPPGRRLRRRTPLAQGAAGRGWTISWGGIIYIY